MTCYLYRYSRTIGPRTLLRLAIFVENDDPQQIAAHIMELAYQWPRWRWWKPAAEAKQGSGIRQTFQGETIVHWNAACVCAHHFSFAAERFPSTNGMVSIDEYIVTNYESVLAIIIIISDSKDTILALPDGLVGMTRDVVQVMGTMRLQITTRMAILAGK